MSDETTDTTAAAAGATPEPGGTVTVAANSNVPPAGEDIHLPPGTPIPLIITIGITLTLIGTTASWTWTIIGGIIFIVALLFWIRDTRKEVAHLPDDLSLPGGGGHH